MAREATVQGGDKVDHRTDERGVAAMAVQTSPPEVIVDVPNLPATIIADGPEDRRASPFQSGCGEPSPGDELVDSRTTLVQVFEDHPDGLPPDLEMESMDRSLERLVGEELGVVAAGGDDLAHQLQ